MNDELMETIENLHSLIKEYPNRYIFSNPTTKEKISAYEQKYKVQLPESYKLFLLHFNGGFISDEEGDIDLENKVKVYIGWGFNQFLGIEDIDFEYDTFLDEDDCCQNNGVRYKDFIPFMLTDNNEKIAFNVALSSTGESPVYDCFHEVGAREWNMLYDNFLPMLIDYIKYEGKLNTVA